MKIEKLRKKMSASGLDAVLVLDHLNIHYLSDFAFSDGMLFITDKSAHLLTDFRYYEMALNGADRAFEVTMTKERDKLLHEIIEKDNVKSVGFEGNTLSFATYKSFTERFSEVKFADIGAMIEEIRQVKDKSEIEKIQKAQDIADAAFARVLKMITTDMTEIEVALELEYAMRRGGAEAFSFETIAVSGDASSLPHGTPRNVKLKTGFLTMDFGAKYEGYCSDMTRTVVIGRADNEMKKLYNTVLKAQLSAIEYLREGADCSDADKVARDIIDSVPEYKGTFGHSLGHSVGLFVHESPALTPRAKGRKLRAGEIMTVEPGIYLFGKYGCRIEDMVAIEKEGVYNFTKSPKELIEIY